MYLSPPLLIRTISEAKWRSAREDLELNPELNVATASVNCEGSDPEGWWIHEIIREHSGRLTRRVFKGTVDRTLKEIVKYDDCSNSDYNGNSACPPFDWEGISGPSSIIFSE